MTRAAEIEEFIRKHPERVRKIPAPAEAEDQPSVKENPDRVLIDPCVHGNYRRRKHRGSDDQ